MTLFKGDSLNRTSDQPLYQQLYAHLRASILSGKLKGGTKLPSSRTLADELGLSRNTVRTTYAQLMAEGYLESLTGGGTFVARVLPDSLLKTPAPKTSKRAKQVPSAPLHLSQHARAQLATLQMATALSLSREGLLRPFNAATPALTEFPHKVWGRLVARHARRRAISSMTYQDLGGYRPLCEAIAEHVTVARSVNCTPEQIVITSGAQGALDLAARVLLDSGDQVWLEDPGYLGAKGAFLGVGATIVPVPVDKEGLVVEAGVFRAPRARLAFVTPSHQFPLGMTMSLSRRLALLEWAKSTNSYILEDDYDSEYRFKGRPLAALQGLDEAGRVIYIGTFTKVLFPALRIGYLVLPQPLTEAFTVVRSIVDIHPPTLEQAALADFMTEGHFNRHLRRMRKIYAERRDLILHALRGLPLRIDAPETGLNCVVWLPDSTDEVDVVRQAERQGLALWPVSAFCSEPVPGKAVLVGFGGYSNEELKPAARRLAKLLGNLCIFS
jgi:GntR family transcriptional regulator / MocR family aminotransferase